MKINTHKLFDELCTEIYYGLNFKIALMDLGKKEVDVLIDLLSACRAGRKAEPFSPDMFVEAPSLKLSWEAWNSGGGCMIWSHEFCDGTSVHVTDECLILSKYNIEKHREAEFDDSEEDFYLYIHHFEVDYPECLGFYLCPFLGQEMADLIMADVNEIHRCW